MKKFVVLSLMMLMFITPSCQFLQDSALNGLVLTTDDNLVATADKTDPTQVYFVPETMVPAKVLQDPRFANKKFVVVDETLVKADAPKVSFVPESTGSWLSDVFGFGIGIVSTWVPKLAALEGLLVLLSRRKRQHYTDAIVAALPYDGNVDLKGAAVSVGRALGIAHSSPQTKQVAEEARVTLHG